MPRNRTYAALPALWQASLGLYPAQLLEEQVSTLRKHLKELVADESYDQAQVVHNEVSIDYTTPSRPTTLKSSLSDRGRWQVTRLEQGIKTLQAPSSVGRGSVDSNPERRQPTQEEIEFF